MATSGDDITRRYRGELDTTFRAAKEKDECEYIITLLRLRGTQAPGRDSFEESYEAVQDSLSLPHAPLQEVTRARLAC